MSPISQHLQPLSSISAMLGNTLRSWSGWMDLSTACTCECASQCVHASGSSQPISPQTADGMLRSSSDTYEQPCTVSSISSHSITVIKGKSYFLWSNFYSDHKYHEQWCFLFEIFVLTWGIKVKWLAVFTMKWWLRLLSHFVIYTRDIHSSQWIPVIGGS